MPSSRFIKYGIPGNSEAVQHLGESRSRSANVHHGCRSGSACSMKNIHKVSVLSSLCQVTGQAKPKTRPPGSKLIFALVLWLCAQTLFSLGLPMFSICLQIALQTYPSGYLTLQRHTSPDRACFHYLQSILYFLG